MSPRSCAPLSVTAMTDAGTTLDSDSLPEAPKRSIRKIVLRIFFVVGALALSFWILARTFDDLDVAEIRSAVASLNDAEAVVVRQHVAVVDRRTGPAHGVARAGSGGASRRGRLPRAGGGDVGRARAERPADPLPDADVVGTHDG